MTDLNSVIADEITAKRAAYSTANNALRHTYRELSAAEKSQIQAIKDKGQEFITILHRLGATDANNDRFGSRDLSLANTHIEDAVMRAVRHITA